MKTLFALVVLCLTPAFATDYSVVGYGSAACDGSTNDATAFANTYAQVQSTGGGRVLVPSGKTCRLEGFLMDNTSGIESVRGISLESDGGGMATLTCQSCAVLITIGTSDMNPRTQLHKSVKNLKLDLSESSNVNITGIYARDIHNVTVENVRIENSNDEQTGAKGIYFYGHGSDTCADNQWCHSSGNLIIKPYINGYFYVGIQLDGENTGSNSNVVGTTILGGSVLRPYGEDCSDVVTSTYGILSRYAASNILYNVNVEGFNHGIESGGLNLKVFGGRTECNNVGVYVNDSTYANHYHTSLVGSVHSDGWNFNGSNRVSVLDSYAGSFLKTNLENVRQIRQTSTHCTTGTGFGASCNAAITISPALTDTSYMVQCTPRQVSGAVSIYDISKSSGSSFTVAYINLIAGVASAAKLDCLVTHDDGLGATVTP